MTPEFFADAGFWPDRQFPGRSDFTFWQGDALAALRSEVLGELLTDNTKVRGSNTKDDTSFLIGLVSELAEIFGVISCSHTPKIVGIAGSVAVGKSALAEALVGSLRRRLGTSRVSSVSTDGFLFPSHVLIERNLMARKGFPESYDRTALLDFLSRLSSGERGLCVPVYAHELYDIAPECEVLSPGLSVVVLEGLNILQDQQDPSADVKQSRVHEYLSLSVFLDADETALKRWYIERSLQLFRRRGAARPEATDLASVLADAENRWNRINLKNLRENILPSRSNADVVIKLDANHCVVGIAFTKTAKVENPKAHLRNLFHETTDVRPCNYWDRQS